MALHPAHRTDLIAFASRAEMLAKSKEFWNPDKTQFWIDSGVPLVIDRRDGYFIYDVDGKRLIDVHLNGGTYNLGHRNPEIVQAVTAAMQRFDTRWQGPRCRKLSSERPRRTSPRWCSAAAAARPSTSR